MPLPKPKSNEKKSEFVSRCISEVAKDPKYKDNKQRVAICYTQFDEAKSEASIVAEVDGEEVLVFAASCGDYMKKNKAQECSCETECDCGKEGEEEEDMEDGMEQEDEAAQKTYNGKKRSELKDSDFLFPAKRSFPITTPQDVRDAINNFGRMGGKMSYDAFIKKLYQKAKSMGPNFVGAIPDSTKEKYKLS